MLQSSPSYVTRAETRVSREKLHQHFSLFPWRCIIACRRGQTAPVYLRLSAWMLRHLLQTDVSLAAFAGSPMPPFGSSGAGWVRARLRLQVQLRAPWYSCCCVGLLCCLVSSGPTAYGIRKHAHLAETSHPVSVKPLTK